MSPGTLPFPRWDSEQFDPFASVSQTVLKRFFQNVPPRFLLDPVRCHQIEPIKDKRIRTGFATIVITEQRHEYEIADLAAFARALVYSPLIFESRDCGGVAPDDIADALADALRTKRGANPTRDPMQAILFETQKR